MRTMLSRTTHKVEFLGLRACLKAPPGILRELLPLLPISPEWQSANAAPLPTTIEIACTMSGRQRYGVARDGKVIWTGNRPEDVIAYVEWLITSTAIEQLADQYLIHAGAVAWGPHGMMLPAPSGSGKSSLVARLVADGWTYFSDEVAVIDAHDRTLLPFAKSLHLHEGTRAALAWAHPTLEASASYGRLEGERIWYLPPVRAWLPRSPVNLDYIVIPSFVANAQTRLTPVSPTIALGCLITQSFNLRQHGSQAIGAVVHILHRAACYTLTYGDLDEAAAVLRGIVQMSALPTFFLQLPDCSALDQLDPNVEPGKQALVSSAFWE